MTDQAPADPADDPASTAASGRRRDTRTVAKDALMDIASDTREQPSDRIAAARALLEHT